jgi:dipeptidyl aminopeptidase/acylaminoacyl peptidase
LKRILDQEQILANIDKVIQIPDLALLDVTKDNRYALFVSSQSGSYQLWSLELKKGNIAQVSHGDQRVIWASISPDSKKVVFSRDLLGAELHQFFIAPVQGNKEEEQISNLDNIRVFDFSYSPDGKEIAFCGATEKGVSLWLFDLKSGKTSPLYTCKGSISSPVFSKSGKMIVSSIQTTGMPRSAELVFINRKGSGGEINTYTPLLGSENTGPKWHPSKERVLFKTNARRAEYDLAIYDYSTRKLEYLRASRFGFDFANYGWTRDGRTWFVAEKNGRSRLYLRKGAKLLQSIPIPRGKIKGTSLTRDSFVICWSSLSEPPQIGKITLRNQKNNYKSLCKPEYDKSLPLGRAKFLSYKSFDGLTIPSYMVFAGGKKDPRPCVVWPHGGPWWEVGDEWNPAIQAIASSGFHVFCPNFRGSTGYGAKFERMDLGDPGGADLQDVVLARQFVIDRGFAQDDKIAIAGASYGGFMTFIAMTKAPDLWKAGAAIVGITDWKEMYELSDASFRSFVEELLGDPVKEAELYRDRSAINFVEQIQNPILIWHRANDSRCPLQPIQKFVDKLKELGKRYEFTVVEGEGHGFQKTENLARQYKGVVTFLLSNLAAARQEQPLAAT